jgi:hypothetical protein
VAGARYPLQIAERMREAERAAAERALSDALAAERTARAALDHAERVLGAHADERPAVEAALLGGGAAIGALELQRRAAFAQRHADEARALRERCGAARDALAACEAARRAAQDAFGRARANQRAIERDHARFDAAQRRELLHAEQVEVEERLARSRKERGR